MFTTTTLIMGLLAVLAAYSFLITGVVLTALTMLLPPTSTAPRIKFCDDLSQEHCYEIPVQLDQCSLIPDSSTIDSFRRSGLVCLLNSWLVD